MRWVVFISDFHVELGWTGGIEWGKNGDDWLICRYIEVFRSSQEEFENNGMLRSGIPSIISSGRMQSSPPNMRGGSRGGPYPNNDYGGKYGNSGSGHGG